MMMIICDKMRTMNTKKGGESEPKYQRASCLVGRLQMKYQQLTNVRCDEFDECGVPPS